MTQRALVPVALRNAMLDRRRRLLGYAIAALVLALLAVFPQPYIGRARILPRDPSSALGSAIGGAGGRIQDLGALLGGNGRAIDLYLAVAQSDDIRNEVIARLHLAGPNAPYATQDKASVQLEKTVDVQSLPGSILQIEAKTHDRDQALALTRAFGDAIARHLRALNNEQVSVKQALLDVRFREAASRLAHAQAALNEFRRANRISAAPEAELGSAIALKSGIEAKLKAKVVELKAMQDMLGPDNVRLRETETEIQSLREQLAQTTNPTHSAGGPNAGGLTELSTEYLDLYRDYLFAQSIYEVYSRVSEQVAVEDLSGRDAPTVQFIELPHIDPGIHVNVWATAALIGLLLLVVFAEVYAPATGIDLWNAVKPDDAP
jgi:hypothetical protein